MINKNIFLVIFLFLVAFNMQAQKGCENLIGDAEQLFESGYYDSVLTTLNNGMNICKLNKATKEQAYLLMIKSQIEKNNSEEVKNQTYNLLRNNPNYTLEGQQGNVVFRNTLNKFSVFPFFSLGLYAGINTSPVEQLNTYSILDSADYSKNIDSKFGSTFGISTEFEFIKNFSICINGSLSYQSYERIITGANNFELSFTEKFSGYEFPIYAKYYYSINKIKLFVLAGYYSNTLRSSSANIQLFYSEYDSTSVSYDTYQKAANDISTKEMRNEVNSGWLAGLGVSYQINNFRFHFDAKYFNGQTEFVNHDNRYSNPDFLLNYYYIDNDIKISKMEFSFGVQYILFHNLREKKN